jgi:hypothetical protein
LGFLHGIFPGVGFLEFSPKAGIHKAFLKMCVVLARIRGYLSLKDEFSLEDDGFWRVCVWWVELCPNPFECLT